MFEMELKTRNTMPFPSLSSTFPEVTIYRWCNSAVDYLEFHGRDSDIESIWKSLHDTARNIGSHIVHESRAGNHASVMFSCVCSVHNSTIRILESVNCLWQAPVIYRNGYETITAIGFSEAELIPLLDKLQERGEASISRKREIRPESLRDVYTIPMSTLLGKLTGKQLTTLRNAIDRGYFSSPKKVLIEGLAAESGISKSTMQEHINKALNRMVSAMGPYLNLMIEYTSAESGSPGNET